jgi:chaperonin GroES
MQVKPLGNRILVKQLTAEEVTKSGIILAQTSDKQEKSQYEIIELGNGEAVGQLNLKIGDKVIAGKYSGDEVDVNDDTDAKYKILYVGKEKDESDVLAVIH